MDRRLVIALVLSIAVNIFGVGFIAGRLIGAEPTPAQFTQRAPLIASPFNLLREADAVPEVHRATYRNAFQTHLPKLRKGHAELQALHRELFTLLRAEEFDREAIEARMAVIHDAQRLQHEAVAAALLDALETLPENDRRELLSRTQSRAHKRNKHGHKRERPAD